MNENQTRVSICMAVYNGSYYISEQIDSVLSQLGENDELIIGDDCSTDHTKEIISGYRDSRIKYLLNAERLGVTGNFEHLVSIARGKYIFLCDQDDVWMQNKIEECLRAISGNLMVISDCVVTDSKLQVMCDSFFQSRGSGPGVLKNLWKNSYLGCCMVFDRDLLKYAIPFPTGIPMHDMWLGLIADFHGAVKFIPSKLVLYRRHENTVSPTAKQSSAGILIRISSRLNLFFSLVFRLTRNYLLRL